MVEGGREEAGGLLGGDGGVVVVMSYGHSRATERRKTQHDRGNCTSVTHGKETRQRATCVCSDLENCPGGGGV